MHDLPFPLDASPYAKYGVGKEHAPPMLGFKTPVTASVILSGIELVHMMRKPQARFAFNPNPSLAEQFEILAAA